MGVKEDTIDIQNVTPCHDSLRNSAVVLSWSTTAAASDHRRTSFLKLVENRSLRLSNSTCSGQAQVVDQAMACLWLAFRITQVLMSWEAVQHADSVLEQKPRLGQPSVCGKSAPAEWRRSRAIETDNTGSQKDCHTRSNDDAGSQHDCSTLLLEGQGCLRQTRIIWSDDSITSKGSVGWSCTATVSFFSLI